MTRLPWWTRLNDRITLFFSKRTNRWTGAWHNAVYRATGGRIGGKVGALLVLLLTTTGRKSGQARTVPLNYVRDGEEYVICASNAGRDAPPLWFLNVQADPQATIEVGSKRLAVTARVATAAERGRIWPEWTRRARNYAVYEGMTGREIPLVLLRVTGDG